MADYIRIGQTRIRDKQGYRGTVLYVGPVASASNSDTVYAGVRWDDCSRGKHDGSVICTATQQLVRHFDAGHATAGSFVKVSKLDTGVVLNADLLQQRYVALDDPNYVANSDNQLEHVMAHGNKRVEFLGEQHIRHYQQVTDLKSISFRLSGISRVDCASLKNKYHQLQELDVAGNLFGDWEAVFLLLGVFPNLQSLSMASNRLNDLTLETTTTYETLTHLNVKDTNLQNLQSIVTIGTCLPNLRELILANNNENGRTSTTTVTPQEIATALPNLEYLDASRCTLFDSVQIWSLLPELRFLSLNDTAHVTSFAGSFPSLEILQVAHTGLADWPVLPKSVTHLRLPALPWDTKHKTISVRTRIIAQFPQLQHINGSPTTKMERRDAARWCRNMPIHPQAEHWKKEYPELWKRGDENTNGTQQHYLSVVNVTITSLAAVSCTKPPLTKRLPVNMSLRQLQQLCARHFGLDVDLQVFTVCRTAQSLPEVVTSLADVPDGSHLYMDEREATSLEPADKGYHNIEQQEEQLNDFLDRQKSANASLGLAYNQK